jgi:protein O-mannosyl-transferase
MAKKQYQKPAPITPRVVEKPITIITPILVTASDTPSWLNKISHGFIPFLIIAILSFAIYSNTFNNQFALDDDIVICKNEHVLKGLAGLPKIFTEDLFDSYYKQMNTQAQLSGGRYRPLSVATFALEQEFVGTLSTPDSVTRIIDSTQYRQAFNAFLANHFTNGWDVNKNGKGDIGEDINKDGNFNDKDTKVKGFTLRHINNALLYALACCMIFLFLSRVVFKETPWLSLLVTLLFAAHPIHTEVVANVKSRDEILSILFIMLTLYFAHQFEVKKHVKFALLACFCTLCALLSKEYGATLFLLIPISFHLFGGGIRVSKNIGLYAGLFVTGLIYFFMRKSANIILGGSDLQDEEIMNSPFKYATAIEQLATQFFIFLKYLWLLIFPNTLISDYGYNSIPYKNFSNPGTLAGFVLMIGLIVLAIKLFIKRHWMAFPLALYMLNMLLVTNFIFNIGATMGERLAFHSSLGFCMLLGYGIYWLSKKTNNLSLSAAILLPILVLYSIKTYSRNKAWESDITLALTDVENQPQSVALNGNASSRNIDLSELPKNNAKANEYIQKSIKYGKKAVGMHNEFVNGYINLGIAYLKLQKNDSAKIFADKAFSIYPHHPQRAIFESYFGDSFAKKANEFGAKGLWYEGKLELQKAVAASPNNARYWYDLGGFSYNSKDYTLAKQAWKKAFELNPNDPDIIKVQNVIP